MDKQKFMRDANDTARALGAADDAEFEQWVSYLLEAIEAESQGGPRKGDEALRKTFGILVERLQAGGW